MLKNKVSTLLVDLDGTLVASNEKLLTLYATFDLVKALSKHATKREAFKTLREITKAVGAAERSEKTNELRGVEVLARRFNVDPQKAGEILEGAIQESFPKWKNWFSTINGAMEFLNWAKTNHNLILATNPVWSESIVKMRAQWGGIDTSVFRTITHVGSMHSCKPNPEYYQEILEQNGLQASDCLHIGNDFVKDMAAVFAGIPVFIVSKKRFSEVTPVGSRVPAWTGSFLDLKALLEQPLSRPAAFPISH